ncbi:MAG TPA: sodium:solute symporter [Flavipsychrobacter sp.]|nr:sodium:solute symporter [Flavipsychrobacter sp.]
MGHLVYGSAYGIAAANLLVLLVYTTLVMSKLDWIIMLVTLAAIVTYGVYKGRGQVSAQSYLLADRKMPWYIVLLGIMATQASAVTFLSAPGQAYTDGMRFVQYYFGLPIAMVVICITFIPIFQRLNVYTAYEYLEHRFDRKTRLLTSFLFLLSRGLSTGISIYAPSIILSSIMGWNIYVTNVVMGGLLIIYTYTGGAKAVAHTQKLQFLIIMMSMAVAGYLVVKQLPKGVNMGDALFIAGRSGKLNVITTNFNWKDKYNIWSGIIGGFFLALSYFGTDQSQVGRYITAKNDSASKQGLLINGLVKIPMQFLILLIGALLFAFYSFHPAPLYFNEASYNSLKEHQPVLVAGIEKDYKQLHQQYEAQASAIAQARKQGNQTILDPLLQKFRQTQEHLKLLRNDVLQAINKNHYASDATDTNYIFLYFVKNSLPKGLIGLLFAVIFLASWGSISAALNSLTASSLMDIQLLYSKTKLTPSQELWWGRAHTLGWGVFCIGVAMFATRMGSLIEAVNVLGSLFYGTILGIFLVAFYMKSVKANTVFIAAIITEICIIVLYNLDIVSFLWLNVIGALLVVTICLPGMRRSPGNSKVTS